MNEKAQKAIGSAIEAFRIMRYCGPSSDPDEQSAVIIIMNDVIKKIKYCTKYIFDQELKNEILSIRNNPENIYEVHDIRGDLEPIIDSLEDYYKEQLLIKDQKIVNLSPLKRVSLIGDIAGKLQETMNTSSINSLLYGYKLKFKSESISQSKRIYVSEILMKSDDPIIIKIAQDLKLHIENDFLQTRELNKVGHEYIKEQIEKCQSKIENDDHNGAITNARSLIESVCLYILDEAGVTCVAKGNLNKIYKQVYKLLSMDPQKYDDHESLKQICTGFISVINGLSSMRNEMSDAHGKNKSSNFKPCLRHALLATNGAKIISDYLLMSYLKE
jgi:hypothetical protein